MRVGIPGLTLVAALLISSSVAGATAVSAPPVAVAFTRAHNVYLMVGTGRAQAITTRGTPTGIQYPAYSWSPDGKYLLLVRWQTSGSKGDLLLINRNGKLLRTLAAGIPAPADFWPGWAIDGDQIAFDAHDALDRTTRKQRHRIERVDVQGHRSYLFSYASYEGCGGGSDDPGEIAYWNEVGYEGNHAAISWSMKQHLAAYQSTCAGGVNVTNTQTGQTGTQARWVDPALSSRGVLAVTQRANGARRSGPGALLLVDPGSGTVKARPGVGEVAAWTRDGRGLYFVRRSVARVVHARDTAGDAIQLTFYRSEIVHAWANGSHQQTLLSADAYGFSPLNILPGGSSLIFSRIDNARTLWRSARNGTIPTTASQTDSGRYAVGSQVQRLDAGTPPVTLARNASSPAAGT